MARFQREGWVSIWVGTMSSQSEFESYIEEEYGEDTPPSEFAREHDIDYYDADIREALFQEPAQSLREFLRKGFSYSSSFVDAAEAASRLRGGGRGNCVLLLYDFKYEPQSALAREGTRVCFIAAVPYVGGGEPAA